MATGWGEQGCAEGTGRGGGELGKSNHKQTSNNVQSPKADAAVCSCDEDRVNNSCFKGCSLQGSLQGLFLGFLFLFHNML